MQKQKRIQLLFLVIIACFIIYTWAIMLFTDTIATWRHYISLFAFIVLIFFYFKNTKWVAITTAVLLMLAAFNFGAITLAITTNAYWLRISSFKIKTPAFQLLPLGLLVLFLILNIDNLINWYLDHKEAKQK